MKHMNEFPDREREQWESLHIVQEWMDADDFEDLMPPLTYEEKVYNTINAEIVMVTLSAALALWSLLQHCRQ